MQKLSRKITTKTFGGTFRSCPGNQRNLPGNRPCSVDVIPHQCVAVEYE